MRADVGYNADCLIPSNNLDETGGSNFMPTCERVAEFIDYGAAEILER